MEPMLVTRDVFQLEMSALKLPNSKKSSYMSVIAETSQPAMGPYVAMASVELASYARTAACRSALVVKMVAAVPRMFIASMPVVVRAGGLRTLYCTVPTLVGAHLCWRQKGTGV